MDCEMTHKKQKHFKHDCKMEGAIMMSNRTTKQECLAKKLFGLPPNMINFTERVKAGMLLFLFEYEERKLYGVFEATTDGAMNIVPNAFQSQGKSFPAQVLFRRIWMCRPLSEDEFSHAIIHNYYSPKKFHFSLSYDQVFKLVQLFSLRKINVIQNLHYVPNKIIRMFQKDYGDHGRIQNSHLIDTSVNGSVSACTASSLEISPLSEDPDSIVDSSNTADVSFERYDPTNYIDTFVEGSNSEKEINSSPSHYICPNTKKDKPDINAFKSVEYNESDECYPSTIKPRLRSDTEVKRTSVFSRLSTMDPNAAMKRSFSGSDKVAESFELSKKLECNSNMSSANKFLGTKSANDVDVFRNDYIAEARPNLKWMRETEMDVHTESGAVNDGTLCSHKKLDNNNSTTMFLRKKSAVDINVFKEDCIDEARPNLKRIRETEMTIYNETGDIDDGTIYNDRKLELLITEETNQPKDGSNGAEVETEAAAHDELDKISLCLEDSLPSESSLGKAASNNTEKGSSGRKKEVKSRNLLWFLEKTSNIESNILDAAAHNEQTECN